MISKILYTACQKIDTLLHFEDTRKDNDVNGFFFCSYEITSYLWNYAFSSRLDHMFALQVTRDMLQCKLMQRMRPMRRMFLARA